MIPRLRQALEGVFQRVEGRLEEYEGEVEYRLKKLEEVGSDVESLEANLRQAMNALATQGLQERLAGHSLWWRPADDGLEPTLSLVAGLPDATAFAAMLSGR